LPDVFFVSVADRCGELSGGDPARQPGRLRVMKSACTTHTPALDDGTAPRYSSPSITTPTTAVWNSTRTPAAATRTIIPSSAAPA
jgi:hypothetical protein